MSKKITLIKKFLSEFWDPLVVLMKEPKVVIDTKVKFWMVEELEMQVDKNDNIPSGLFFSHNGNHMSHNQKWKHVKFWAADAVAPFFNCFYIDIDAPKDVSDIGDWKTNYLDVIYKVINSYKIIPTHVVESKNWYHLYRVIKKEDRKELWKTINKKWFFAVNEYLREMFWWDPNARWWQSLWSVARLPYSMHWKSWEPYELSIIDRPWKPLTIAQVMHAEKYVEDNKIIKKNEGTYYKSRWGSVFDSINKISLLKIIEAINKNPRRWRKFFVKSNGSIDIEMSWAEIIHTDGYKYNKEANYINCFSSVYHPISQRPRGWPYSFVYHYFIENHLVTQKFFKDNFDVSIDSGFYEQEEIIYGTINQAEYDVEFANTGVFMIPKGAAVKNLVRSYLFRDQMEIVWIGNTKKRAGGLVENEFDEKVIIVKINNQEPEILRIMPSKTTFNNKYARNCFFYWSDNQLGMFFNSIQKAGYFKDLSIYDQNGWYNDCVILWWNIIYKKNTFSEESQIVIENQHRIIEGNTTMTPNKYLKKLSCIIDKSIVVPAFLQSLALAWMNIRDDQIIYPGLLLTGKTWSGKSTLSDLIKQYLWYDMNARAYWLPALTAQPLSIYASDPEVLFLDELTEEVSIKAEELLRNIINRDRGWRWLGNGNAFYDYKAPLFITWERVFREESLNNRFVIINVQKKFQITWGRDNIRELHWLSWVDHIYKTYEDSRSELKPLYEKYSNMLSWRYESRHADVRAYIFVMRDIFEIEATDEELIKYMNNSLSLLWFDKTVETDSLYDLSVFLIRGIHQKKIIYSVISQRGDETHWFIFSDDSFVETNRTKIRYMVSDINETLWEELISINNYDIKIKNNWNKIVDSVMDNIQSVVGSKLYKITKRFNNESYKDM